MERRNDIGTIKDLVAYRLETAKNDIVAAKTLLGINEYKGANNRSYYAIFHTISAIHALDGNSYKKHKDAIANFNKNYIRTEIFDRDIGRKISRAAEIRHASDYDDFYIATRKEAENQIEIAEELLKLIQEYCQSKYSCTKL